MLRFLSILLIQTTTVSANQHNISILLKDGSSNGNTIGGFDRVLSLVARKSNWTWTRRNGPVVTAADCSDDDVFWRKKKEVDNILGTERIKIENDGKLDVKVPFVACTRTAQRDHCQAELMRKGRKMSDWCTRQPGQKKMLDLIKSCYTDGFALQKEEGADEIFKAIEDLLEKASITRIKVIGYAGGTQRKDKVLTEDAKDAWLALALNRAEAFKTWLPSWLKFDPAESEIGEPGIKIIVDQSGLDKLRKLKASPPKEECIKVTCEEDMKKLRQSLQALEIENSRYTIDLTALKEKYNECQEQVKKCKKTMKKILADADVSQQVLRHELKEQEERWEKVLKEKDEKYGELLQAEIAKLRDDNSQVFVQVEETHNEILVKARLETQECIAQEEEMLRLVVEEKNMLQVEEDKVFAIGELIEECEGKTRNLIENKEEFEMTHGAIMSKLGSCKNKAQELRSAIETQRTSFNTRITKEKEKWEERARRLEEKLTLLKEEKEKLQEEKESMKRQTVMYEGVFANCEDERKDCLEDLDLCKEERDKPCPPVPRNAPPPLPIEVAIQTSDGPGYVPPSGLPEAPNAKADKVCRVGGGYIYCEDCGDKAPWGQLWCRNVEGGNADVSMTCMGVCKCYEVDRNSAGLSGGQRNQWKTFSFGFGSFTCGKPLTQWEFKFEDEGDRGSMTNKAYQNSIKRRRGFGALM